MFERGGGFICRKNECFWKRDAYFSRKGQVPYFFAYFSRKGLGPLAGRVFLENGARSLGGLRISREMG